MRPMRIAFVAPGFVEQRDDPGMPAVVDLVERVARVADVELIALRHPPRRGPYRVAGAEVRSLALGLSRGPVGRATVMGRGLRAVLATDRRRRIDLVHGLWADEPGAVAVVAARLLRRPSVVSVLGGELVALPDIDYGAALGRGGRWTTRLALQLADAVTVGSTPLAASVGARGNREAQVLPLGVELATFSSATGVPSGATTILFVGSLEPVKDPGLLLRAFAALAAARPGLTLRLVGSGSLRGALEAESAALGLVGRVRFDGEVARRDLPPIYRAATVLAVPSRHEAQSMVAVEAAACGLPVVGSRVGAVADLAHREAALTITPGDLDGLSSGLAAIIDDPELAHRMAVAATAAAVERFDLATTSAAFLDLYNRLLSSAGDRGQRGGERS
jgi:glycosyltransferase involved in cell wall biosynthesis